MTTFAHNKRVQREKFSPPRLRWGIINTVKICPVCSREYPRDMGKCPDDGVLLVSLDTGMGFNPEELIGQVVDGRFRIDGIIGKGGMGTVYSLCACRGG